MLRSSVNLCRVEEFSGLLDSFLAQRLHRAFGIDTHSPGKAGIRTDNRLDSIQSDNNAQATRQTTWANRHFRTSTAPTWSLRRSKAPCGLKLAANMFRLGICVMNYCYHPTRRDSALIRSKACKSALPRHMTASQRFCCGLLASSCCCSCWLHRGPMVWPNGQLKSG